MDIRVNHPALHRMVRDVNSLATRLYDSPIARMIVFGLSVFLIVLPAWTVMNAFSSGWILLSPPTVSMFFTGLVGLRMALKWGRYG